MGYAPNKRSHGERENKEAIQFIKVKMANNFLNFYLRGFYNIFLLRTFSFSTLQCSQGEEKFLGMNEILNDVTNKIAVKISLIRPSFMLKLE